MIRFQSQKLKVVEESFMFTTTNADTCAKHEYCILDIANK